ncbi:MAG TPA: hypothetical protein VKU37_05145 [Verrucomicrobiae bacterium]|nr:hypothetical protein [Verrucomicrobiae bacterium]
MNSESGRHQMFHDEALSKGDVEVFSLIVQPKTKSCHGWVCGEPEEFIIILELPPVTDVPSEVKLGTAYQIKKARAK